MLSKFEQVLKDLSEYDNKARKYLNIAHYVEDKNFYDIFSGFIGVLDEEKNSFTDANTYREFYNSLYKITALFKERYKSREDWWQLKALFFIASES